jgi:hypothetical protein
MLFSLKKNCIVVFPRSRAGQRISVDSLTDAAEGLSIKQNDK